MNKAEKRILLALAGLAAVLVLALLLVLRAQPEPERIAGTFVPPPFEEKAQSGTPPLPEAEARYGALPVEANYNVSLCAAPAVTAEGAWVWLTNPADNTVWLKLRLADEQGNVLGQTGLLRPGEYLPCVPLEKQPRNNQIIIATLLSYQPDTYFSRGTVSAQLMCRVTE